MRTRLAHLSKMAIFSVWRRLYANFSKEFVIGVSALVLLGLYYYIFNDFLNNQVKDISEKMQALFINVLSVLTLVFTSLRTGRQLSQDLNSPRSLRFFAKSLGENNLILFSFGILWSLSCIAFFHGLAWFILLLFISWTKLQIAGTAICMAMLSLSYACFTQKRRFSFWPSLQKKLSSRRLSVLCFWRLKQMTYKNDGAQKAMMLAFLTALAHSMISPNQHGLFGHWLLAFCSGLLFALALIFQCSFDLRYSAFEKSLGVSHQEYQITLILLSFIVALLAVITNSGISFFMMEKTELLKIGFLALTPPILVPFLALQIDGTRVGIQLLSVLLLALFIGTAICATNYAVLLLPIIGYYGIQSQANRYYRA